ncbi:MAG: diacylglycerol kinase [Actinomycetota bacterium]|nr:MAG: diacylglycerol kinase [Actinomycetota bacterium]
MTAADGPRVAVVVKPADDPQQRAELAAALSAAGLTVMGWWETTASQPGTSQARAAVAAGADLVVVQGGDGTVRSVAAALLGTDVALALVPAGTGNLLARNLGIPAQPAAAAALAATGARRRIDVVELDDEPYLVMGGCGFDARMFAATSPALKQRAGWLAYVVAGLRALRSPAVGVRLESDGRIARTRATGVVVGNVASLTGGVALLPDARPDDGLLDVAVLTAARPREWLGLGWRLLAHRPPTRGQLRRFTGHAVDVVWDVDQPAQVDGDVIASRRTARFRVRPQALTVCVPR